MNSQRTRRRHPIQHPPTSTPSVAGRNSNYRCKAVHSLPVSTTSYFRHVVSTVQSSVIRANNGTVLNRHRRKFIFSSIPFLYSKPFPPGLQFYFPLWFILQQLCHLTRTYNTRVTGITRLLPKSYLAEHFYRHLHTSIDSWVPRENMHTMVPYNS